MDWDGDGRLDLIVGDRPGNVHFFKRLEYGNIFLEEQDLITVAGKPFDIDYNSAPSLVDWNNNGLPDLVIGALSPIPAGLYLLLNSGAPYAPDFQQVDTVLCRGEPIELCVAYPDFHDLNFDGLQDMIVGSANGNIACFVNSGTPEEPLFQHVENLVANGEEIYICSYVRPTVCNWNNDGTPDLLVGDYTGQIYLFTGVPHTGVDDAENLQPMEFTVLQNPVSASLSASLNLHSDAEVFLRLFSCDGRLTGSFNRGSMQKGLHTLQLDVSSLASGLYLLNCTAGEESASAVVSVIR